MLVQASNLPDQFHWAINDRLDDLINFQLPGREERLCMLKLYFNLYVIDPLVSAGGNDLGKVIWVVR